VFEWTASTTPTTRNALKAPSLCWTDLVPCRQREAPHWSFGGSVSAPS
jgi:hypothetical protein